MKLYWYKFLIIIFILGNLITCIEPFSPHLDRFESLLVVDALLTDEYRSNYVYLSRTIMTAGTEPSMVSGALVQIMDEKGNNTILNEISAGVYKTDSLKFKGEAGKSYKLQIKTESGEEYESESCFMWPVQDIDSIYITKGQKIVDTEPKYGIWINIDSRGISDCRYYRWKINEWWKFTVPYPKAFNFVDDSTLIDYFPIPRTCWANNNSSDIFIRSSETGISGPLMFIGSEETDRLLIQYFIEIKQLSISKREYEFWESLQKINETGGDIFDKQPFQIYGNIHNINRPKEQVLGYFQVSGAKVASRYITQSQLSKFDIPRYKYDCRMVVKGPRDFPPPGLTFKQIYNMYTREGLTFIGASNFPGNSGTLVFVTPYCADCKLRGSLAKPDFWIEMN